MTKEPENKADQNNDDYDVVAHARRIVENYLARRSKGDVLSEADEVVAHTDLDFLKSQLGESFAEFSKGYNERIVMKAGVLALPFITRLDEIDAETDHQIVQCEQSDDQVEVYRRQSEVYGDTRIDAIALATRMIAESSGMYPGARQFAISQEDPKEVSIMFMQLMGDRFGDEHDLTGIGWVMIIDGLVGNPITPEEEVAATRDLLNQYRGTTE